MPGSAQFSTDRPQLHFYGLIQDLLESGVSAEELQAIAAQLKARAGQPQPVPAQPAATGAFNLRRALTSRGDTPTLYTAWEDNVTRGPADLICSFVHTAVAEFMPDLEHYDEASRGVMLEVVGFAARTALRMAGVSETWEDYYRSLTSHLRE